MRRNRRVRQVQGGTFWRGDAHRRDPGTHHLGGHAPRHPGAVRLGGRTPVGVRGLRRAVLQGGIGTARNRLLRGCEEGRRAVEGHPGGGLAGSRGQVEVHLRLRGRLAACRHAHGGAVARRGPLREDGGAGRHRELRRGVGPAGGEARLARAGRRRNHAAAPGSRFASESGGARGALPREEAARRNPAVADGPGMGLAAHAGGARDRPPAGGGGGLRPREGAGGVAARNQQGGGFLASGLHPRDGRVPALLAEAPRRVGGPFRKRRRGRRGGGDGDGPRADEG